MRREVVEFEYLAEEVKICELGNVRVKDFYADINLMVNVQKRTKDIIAKALEIPPPDFLFCFGHIKSAEVIGCDAYYPDNDEPFIKKGILTDIDRIKKFKIKNPEDNIVVRDYLKKAKSFFELTGIKSTIFFEGPFTDSCFIRGQTEFFLDLVDKPILCEKLISKVTDAAVEWKRYHDSEMRINYDENIELIDDSIANINPKIFKQIVLPHLLRWYEAFPAPKRSFHCCGNINNFLKILKKLRLSKYEYMGEMVDLKKAKEILRGVYISRLLNFRIIRKAAIKELENYINGELEVGSRGNNFRICVEGQRSIPLSRVRIVRGLVFKWNEGRIPAI